MTHKKWTKVFLSVISLIVTIIVVTNYAVNPYNVFRPNHHTQFNRLKKDIISDRMTAFYEIKFIRPQTLMVGTSRIGYFKSNTLKPYVRSPIYNLSLAGSSVYEQRRYIEYAATHLPVKTIIWSLDFFSFNPVKEPYPAFSEDRLNHSICTNDYLTALFSYRTFERSLKAIKTNRRNGPFDSNVSEFYEQHQYMDVQGQTLSKEEVRKNVNWTLDEYATLAPFLEPKRFREPASIDPKLVEVHKVIMLCKEKNIQLIIYTSPVYREHLDMIYHIGLGKTYEHWKRGLAGMTDYMDFNTYNSLTENIMNFRDSSHMVSDNGKYIFAKLFHDGNVSIPSDFGYMVTSENIDQHLQEQKSNIKPFVFLRDFPAGMKASK